VRDYRSFIAVVSKTLERCLDASDRMTWDRVYPSYAADQEDYSATYIKKTEAIEAVWALQNLKIEDDGVDFVNFTTITVNQSAEPIAPLHEKDSPSNSDIPPPKKQKYANFISLPIVKLTKLQTVTTLPQPQ